MSTKNPGQSQHAQASAAATAGSTPMTTTAPTTTNTKTTTTTTKEVPGESTTEKGVQPGAAVGWHNIPGMHTSAASRRDFANSSDVVSEAVARTSDFHVRVPILNPTATRKSKTIPGEPVEEENTTTKERTTTKVITKPKKAAAKKAAAKAPANAPKAKVTAVNTPAGNGPAKPHGATVGAPAKSPGGNTQAPVPTKFAQSPSERTPTTSFAPTHEEQVAAANAPAPPAPPLGDPGNVDFSVNQGPEGRKTPFRDPKAEALRSAAVLGGLPNFSDRRNE